MHDIPRKWLKMWNFTKQNIFKPYYQDQKVFLRSEKKNNIGDGRSLIWLGLGKRVGLGGSMQQTSASE